MTAIYDTLRLYFLTDFLASNGYLYLFLMSFFAATVLPLGSEWLLATLLIKSLDPFLLLASATLGNFIGACTTYYMGIWGGPVLINKVLRIDNTARQRAEAIYAKYGVWSLFFSWIPVVGDPLCLLAGVFKISFLRFSTLVFAGKLVRYAFIIAITLKLISPQFF